MRLFLFLLLAACSSETGGPKVTTVGSTGSGGNGSGGSGGACTSDNGMLRGTARLTDDPLLTPEQEVAYGALIRVQSAAGGEPVQVMADAEGNYQVELAAGNYQVEAEHETQCSTEQPVDVEIVACEELEQDLLLDACFG